MLVKTILDAIIVGIVKKLQTEHVMDIVCVTTVDFIVDVTIVAKMIATMIIKVAHF